MTQPNNPLHGIKLADMLTELHEFYGWEYLGLELNLNCFKNNFDLTSTKNSLGKLLKKIIKMQINE